MRCILCGRTSVITTGRGNKQAKLRHDHLQAGDRGRALRRAWYVTCEGRLSAATALIGFAGVVQATDYSVTCRDNQDAIGIQREDKGHPHAVGPFTRSELARSTLR
jgi:hypothetical protein